MAQDYKDYVFANGGIEGQVTPTTYSSPGQLSTASLAIVTAQISTQSNNQAGINGLAQAEQVLAVAGPNYSSPSQKNIGNPAGGGP